MGTLYTHPFKKELNMSQALLDRIAMLKQGIEQSAANHHALVGRLNNAAERALSTDTLALPSWVLSIFS